MSFDLRTENYTDKPITEFKDGDTIFIQENKAGFSTNYLVEFKSFERGMVKGIVLNSDRTRYMTSHIGMEISGRISKCYTWLNRGGCHWFKKVGKEWKCQPKLY